MKKSAERAARVRVHVAVALTLLGLSACGESRSTQTVAVGQPAPAYAAPLLDGDTIALADLRGHAVLLNIWATWCIPCRDEMPELQALADRFDDELQVIGVSVDQAGNRDDVRGFLDDHDIDFTILHDPAGRVQRVFRTVGVPETFLIDEDGVLRARWIGRVRADSLESRIREIMDGEA